jgi:hypothetical protein
MIASSKSFCAKIKFLKPLGSCVYALFAFAFPIYRDLRFTIYDIRFTSLLSEDDPSRIEARTANPFVNRISYIVKPKWS